MDEEFARCTWLGCPAESSSQRGGVCGPGLVIVSMRYHLNVCGVWQRYEPRILAVHHPDVGPKCQEW